MNQSASSVKRTTLNLDRELYDAVVDCHRRYFPGERNAPLVLTFRSLLRAGLRQIDQEQHDNQSQKAARRD